MKKSICILIAVAFAGITVLNAGQGIVSRGTDVALEGLSTGRSYNLRTEGKYPYVIINAGNEPEKVIVEIEIPDEKHLKDGYEVIPDPNWVNIIPNSFNLQPNETKIVDIVLSIPDDARYTGKHYQVMLWAHTVGSGMIAAGVRNRLRFSVGTRGPESLQKEKIAKKMVSLDFDIKPDSVFLNDIEPGKVYVLGKDVDQVFKIANRGSKKTKLRVISVPPEQGYLSNMGYEPVPDPSWLEVKPEVLTVKPDGIKSVKMVLKVPDKKEYRGKKYVLSVKTDLPDSDVPVELYNRILVSVKE